MTNPKIDISVTGDKVTKSFTHHKIESNTKLEGRQQIGFTPTVKTFEQLLEDLKIYRECVSIANSQLIQKMKSSIETEGQYISIKRQEEIEICRSSIILIYNNMIRAIFCRVQKLNTETTDNSSFSMKYCKIIENAIQSTIAVTNLLLDFFLL